jgi:hypothetical protein
MTITANPGEANDIDFEASGSDGRGTLVRVEDPGSSDRIPNSTTRRIVAGGTCDQDSTGRHARCPTDGLTKIVVSLGDRGDQYDGENMGFDTELDLGDGDDSGNTDNGIDILRGGAGKDTLGGGGTPSASGASTSWRGGRRTTRSTSAPGAARTWSTAGVAATRPPTGHGRSTRPRPPASR